MDKQKLELEIGLLHQRICCALGDPTRLLILYLLAEKALIVNEIAEALSIPQSSASRHLRILRERNLVRSERQGTAILYSLRDERIITALDIMREILSSQLHMEAQLSDALSTNKNPNKTISRNRRQI
jgi:DNA-binding transcriptional ArsR family regulator